MVGNGDSNGSYTPPIYGDPRGMSQSPDKSGVMFLTMPRTRPDAISSKVELRGAIEAAGRYVPLVTQQMAAMHQQNINNLEIVDRPINLGGGNRMLCQRRFSADKALIEVPGKDGGSLGPLHLNFDPSVMTDFDRTLFDKNHGLPLYYNNFSGILFDSRGLVATSGGNAEGTIFFDPKETAADAKTMFFALSMSTEWEGVADLYSKFDGPSSWMNLAVEFYATGYPAFGRLNLALPGDSSGNAYTMDNLPLSKNIVIGVRTKSHEISYNEGGASSFTSVSELFVNGTKQAELEQPMSSWGSYYEDSRNRLYTSFSGYDSASMGINQKLLYGAHLNDSQMTEVTDNLAAKWGF